MIGDFQSLQSLNLGISGEALKKAICVRSLYLKKLIFNKGDS